MPPKPKAVRYNQHTYALFRSYVPKVPIPEVNLYGFLKSIGLEHEHSKFKSFRQLVEIRFTPYSTNVLKTMGMDVKDRKRLIRHLEVYRRGLMPRHYAYYHRMTPETDPDNL
ncbi:hypothetical protein NDN08_003171 [Rhodosorus marinus]|uniref:Small ribosomal subunit protein mS41 SAM domain-containing protein n=1 Tax=Rhodosorus marinus TaxID=101924 RepID=A0AAV8UVR2_9RHOD|nr:hypothetical protein NDN08_003171 [Rhodosorus marinus]